MRSGAKRAVGGLALTGGVVLLRPGSRANKLLGRQLDHLSRQLRHWSGRVQGLRYRLKGGRPDPTVIDNVLADRIRSELGSLERRLDLPHIHVMVENHVALLHGEVGSEVDADKIERAVEAVSGVAGVESYLHIGLGSGDTRPSAGRAVHPPSGDMHRLLEAAVGAGIHADTAPAVVRGILATFADRLPRDEREQVASHLPADVRNLFVPPRRVRRAAPTRTVHQLVESILATTAELPAYRAENVTAAVLHAFRALVPEEAADVAAVLPADLRSMWQSNDKSH